MSAAVRKSRRLQAAGREHLFRVRLRPAVKVAEVKVLEVGKGVSSAAAEAGFRQLRLWDGGKAPTTCCVAVAAADV